LLRHVARNLLRILGDQIHPHRPVDLGVLLALYHKEDHLVGELHELIADAFDCGVVELDEDVLDESGENRSEILELPVIVGDLLRRQRVGH
jgi:hypothetical protein